MQDSISLNSLSIFIYPIYDFEIEQRKINYVAFEINTKMVHKFDKLLQRTTYSRNDQLRKELNDPASDYYEHVIVHVQFSASTNAFLNMRFSVHTCFQDTTINTPDFVSRKEMDLIMFEAASLIRSWKPREKKQNRKRKNTKKPKSAYHGRNENYHRRNTR